MGMQYTGDRGPKTKLGIEVEAEKCSGIYGVCVKMTGLVYAPQ